MTACLPLALKVENDGIFSSYGGLMRHEEFVGWMLGLGDSDKGCHPWRGDTLAGSDSPPCHPEVGVCVRAHACMQSSCHGSVILGTICHRCCPIHTHT